MQIYTIGYGGRRPDELLSLLTARGIRAIVDVRLRPDRSAMGIFAMAKTADKGIERVLREAGIGYQSLVELGNSFLGQPNWKNRYSAMLNQEGDRLVARLLEIEGPICLLCCEKKPADCHRALIGAFLARTRGVSIVHLE